MTPLQRLQGWAQYVIPHHTASAAVGGLARARVGWWKDLLIRGFLRTYAVDLGEALEGDPRAYSDFNAFFTRALRDGVRPIDADPHAVVSPVDGRLYAAGTIDDGTIVHAKGVGYSAAALLGGDAAAFTGGTFASLYLAPHNYHRVHVPVDASLVSMRWIPGALFSVSPAVTAAIPGVFTRNERVVCRFESAFGPFALVMVGALFVGGIETVWHGVVTQPERRVRTWDYCEGGLKFRKGEELGRFNLGSTVILVFGPGRVAWSDRLEPDRAVRMGETLGCGDNGR